MKHNNHSNASMGAFSFFLAPIVERSNAEIDQLMSIWNSAVEAVNQRCGKSLYKVDEGQTSALLQAMTTLLGAYDQESERLLGFIAIEEDSIERFAVLPSDQCQGIGSALLTAAQEHYQAEYLDLYQDNRVAIQFFEKRGFTPFDETIPEPGDLLAEPYAITHLKWSA